MGLDRGIPVPASATKSFVSRLLLAVEARGLLYQPDADSNADSDFEAGADEEVFPRLLAVARPEVPAGSA
ncbi:hypothetical protein Misp02_10980 [Microtetraspora sp. NBRC 16547]|nr:hypothetical protein Misp02_10980 [Microtetraspora sp. NBRC 16547]